MSTTAKSFYLFPRHVAALEIIHRNLLRKAKEEGRKKPYQNDTIRFILENLPVLVAAVKDGKDESEEVKEIVSILGFTEEDIKQELERLA